MRKPVVPRRPPLASEHRNMKAKVAWIQAEVAKFYGIHLEDMLGPSRAGVVTPWARHVAMTMAGRLTAASSSEIGELFNRDSAMLNYARGSVAGMCASYPDVRREIAELELRLKEEVEKL